jgi:hypothetical protein
VSTIGFSRFLSVPTPVCGPQDLRLVPKTSDPEGLVGAIGAGMEDTALLTTLVRETDVELLMLPGRYTLLDQFALDGLLPACQERGVSVISAAVFHSGVLAQNRPGAGAMFGYRTAPSAVLDRVCAPLRRSGRTSTPLRRLYPLNCGVTSALKGCSTSEYRYLPNRPTPTIRGRQGGRSSHRGHDQPARYDELGDLLLLGPPGAR